MTLFTTRPARQAQAMLRDRRGVSAIEFAMIAPIMILLYVGIVETANAINVYRRTGTIATTAADLTAQTSSITPGELKDIMSAAASILVPHSVSPLKITISSVVADKDNKGTVAWSCSNKGAGRGTNTPYTLPAGLTQPDSSVIVAEATYAFKAPLGLETFFTLDNFNIEKTFYARPRKSLKVNKADTKCEAL